MSRITPPPLGGAGCHNTGFSCLHVRRADGQSRGRNLYRVPGIWGDAGRRGMGGRRGGFRRPFGPGRGERLVAVYQGQF